MVETWEILVVLVCNCRLFRNELCISGWIRTTESDIGFPRLEHQFITNTLQNYKKFSYCANYWFACGLLRLTRNMTEGGDDISTRCSRDRFRPGIQTISFVLAFSNTHTRRASCAFSFASFIMSLTRLLPFIPSGRMKSPSRRGLREYPSGSSGR